MSLSLRTIKLIFCHRSGYLPSDRTGPVLYDSGRHHRHSQRPRHPQVQLQNGPQPPLFHPPGPDHSSPDLRPLWLWHLDPGHLPSTLRPSGLPFQLGGWHRPIDRPRHPSLARARYFADFWEMS